MQPVLQVFQRTALHPVSRARRKVISGQSFTHELGPSGPPVCSCKKLKMKHMFLFTALMDKCVLAP
eukprot:606747-Pelagomonas_calceolata.AAC.1